MEKVCVNHPESPSVGSCKACEKPVCLMCIVEVQGVSFCSDACGSAYQEVKDWLERPAADEEWNPLADTKGKGESPEPAAAAAPAPVAAEAEAEAGDPEPARKNAPSGTEMRAALSTAFGEEGSGAAPTGRAPEPESGSSKSHAPLYIGIAATVLVVVGLVFVFSPDSPPPTPIAVNPTKPEPVKPLPVKPEMIRPEPVKPPPPKPEPVKPEVIKPEPVKPPPPKPEPVKPEVVKPEPVKPPPPKPEPVKPEVVKPEPVKPPPPKPEPVKPEVVKPEPVKPPPPKPEPVKPEVAKPEPPKPEPPKPEPPPAPHLAFVRDPWGKEKPGAWYRIKTSINGLDSYRDVGLRETGAGYRVLVSQSNAGGKTEPEQFTWTEPDEASLFGSVNGDAQGTKYAADVVRTKSSRPSQYVVKEGPHAGLTFPSDAVLTRLDVQTLQIKDRAISCSVMETELKDPKRSVKTWFSTQVPLGAVKTETEGATTAIVDFGSDWAKRPAFPEPPVIARVDPPKPEPVKPEPPKPEPVKPPPPKPEPVKPEPPKPEPVKPPPPKPEPVKPEPEPVKPPPPKPEPAKPEPPKPEPRKEETASRVKKSMTDAAGLIREATPIYNEILGAMDSLPEDKTALRELVGKAERVNLKLGDARILYVSVRADAPDPAVLDRRVSQLDEVLATVQECTRQLKKKLE